MMANEDHGLFWPKPLIQPSSRFPDEKRIQSLEWLIEDEQRRILYQSPDEKHKPLFTGRKRGEGMPGQRLDSELLKQAEYPPVLLGSGWPIGYHIEEAGCRCLRRAQRLGKVKVQFRRHQADVPLDLPDALARATLAAEEANVVAVGLRMVAAEQAEQGRLAAAVGSDDGPTFPLADGP